MHTERPISQASAYLAAARTSSMLSEVEGSGSEASFATAHDSFGAGPSTTANISLPESSSILSLSPLASSHLAVRRSSPGRGTKPHVTFSSRLSYSGSLQSPSRDAYGALCDEQLCSSDTAAWWGSITPMDSIEKIMSSPMRWIHKETNLGQAKGVMQSWGISALLVDTDTMQPGRAMHCSVWYPWFLACHGFRVQGGLCSVFTVCAMQCKA